MENHPSSQIHYQARFTDLHQWTIDNLNRFVTKFAEGKYESHPVASSKIYKEQNNSELSFDEGPL